MKSRGTGKEEVGEQKLINKDAILTAFGGGNRTNKKHGKIYLMVLIVLIIYLGARATK
jgi:hypothetical protein